MDIILNKNANVVTKRSDNPHKGSKNTKFIKVYWNSVEERPDIPMERLNLEINITRADGEASGRQMMDPIFGDHSFSYRCSKWDLAIEGPIKVNVFIGDTADPDNVLVSGDACFNVEGGSLAQPIMQTPEQYSQMLALYRDLKNTAIKRYDIDLIDTYPITYQGVDGYKTPESWYVNFTHEVVDETDSETLENTFKQVKGTLLVTAQIAITETQEEDYCVTEQLFSEGRAWIREMHYLHYFDDQNVEHYDLIGEPAIFVSQGQGAVGPRGLMGPQGDRGEKGERGSKWFTGNGFPSTSLGIVGDVYLRTDGDYNGYYYRKEIQDGEKDAIWVIKENIKGPAGPQGVQGIQGERGVQGEQGIRGLKGDTGERGERGPQGDQGVQGIQGVPGQKGDTGAVGPKGDKGDQGEQGVPGPQGVQGPQGAQGPAGKDGTSFDVWDYYEDLQTLKENHPTGVKGEAYSVGPVEPYTIYTWSVSRAEWVSIGHIQGPKGDQGIQGPQGPQGIAGPKGDTGTTGPKGDKGDTGATGLKGDQGDVGPQGAIGPQGPKGDKGDTGPQGDQGIQGIQGIQGPKGEAGENATIVIGKVTTGAPETPASVTNVGTTTNTVLDFVIPEGKTATNATSLNGETKNEILQTGFIKASSAGAGQSGYIGIVRLTIKNMYVNSPTEFKIIQRGTRTSVTVSIRFKNRDNTDPELDTVTYSGNSNLNAFIRKESTSTWVVYVKKSENYDGIEVIDVAKGNTSNIQVDFIDTFLSSKPSDVTDFKRVSVANYDEDFNNIKSTYLKKAGDRGLELWGITENNRVWNSANPKILFGNAENGQKVALIYNDYDGQRAPAGITVAGEQGNEYFEAPRLFESGKRVFSPSNIPNQLQTEHGNEINVYNNTDERKVLYVNYRGGTKGIKIGDGQASNGLGSIEAGKFIQNGNDIVDNTGSWQLVTKQEIESWDFAFNGLDFEDYDYRIEYDFVKVNSDSIEGIKAFLTENGTTLENKHTRWVQIRAGAPRTSSGTTAGNVQLNAYSVTELNSIWLMDGKTGSQNYFGHVELSKEYTSQDVINFSTYCCMPEYKYCNLAHGSGAVYDLAVNHTNSGASIACNGIKFLTYCTVNGTIKLYRRKR